VPCGSEAEEAFIKANNYTVDLVGGFVGLPSIASSLFYKLSSHAEPLPMLAVGQVVELNATFNPVSPNQSEAFLSHLEERAIRFSEFRLFVFS